MAMTRLIGALLLAAALPAAGALSPDDGQGAARLRMGFAGLRPKLEASPFGRPLYLESREERGVLRGEVHAVVAHDFATVREALDSPRHWCEVLTLPFNVKRCEAHGDDALSLYVVRRSDLPLADAMRIDFRFHASSQADFLESRLEAAAGPVGTKDYRIVLEAVPLDRGRTLLHLSYGYAFGALSRLAMQAYLSTSGADKVGFSTEGRDERGKPRLVGGMRGVLERNTMRYFLAIEAQLASLAAPPPERRRVRLETWYEMTERYPAQLHEGSKQEYLALKGE